MICSITRTRKKPIAKMNSCRGNWSCGQTGPTGREWGRAVKLRVSRSPRDADFSRLHKHTHNHTDEAQPRVSSPAGSSPFGPSVTRAGADATSPSCSSDLLLPSPHRSATCGTTQTPASQLRHYPNLGLDNSFWRSVLCSVGSNSPHLYALDAKSKHKAFLP